MLCCLAAPWKPDIIWTASDHRAHGSGYVTHAQAHVFVHASRRCVSCLCTREEQTVTVSHLSDYSEKIVVTAGP